MSRVLVLLYHRVREYDSDPQLLSVTPEHYREQIVWLKRNYKLVSFDDDWEKLQEDAVCITFDDGYMDNFYNAVPISQELDVPITIFVSTGNIDTSRELWWDELERNMLLDRQYQQQFLLEDHVFGVEFNTSTRERRYDVYQALMMLMKQFVNVDRREKWLKQLRNWNGLDASGRIENVVLQTACLDIISLKNVTIGAHTVHHPMLSALSDDEQYEEISDSKRALEELLQEDIETFSYPFGGKTDYNTKSVEICQELRFKRVASNFGGVWDANTDEYQVPRNLVRDWDIDTFKQKIIEFWKG